MSALFLRRCLQASSHFSANRRGFSLLELIITIAVLILLTTLGVNFFGRSDGKAKLQRGAQMLSAELERARVKADVLGDEVAVFVQIEQSSLARQVAGDAWRRFVLARPSSLERTVPSSWQPQSNWLALPQGVVFASRENGASPQANLLDYGLETALFAGKSGEVLAQGIVFGRRGSVQDYGEFSSLEQAELRQRLRFVLRHGISDEYGRVSLGREQQQVEIFVEPKTGRTRLWLSAEGSEANS